MSQPTKPPSKEPFVGTEELLARVRVAQGKSFNPLQKTLALIVAVGLVVVAVGALLLLRGSHPQSAVSAEPLAQPASTSSLAGVLEDDEQPPPAHSLLKVQVSGNASEIWVDGRKVAKGHAWQGQLNTGPHMVEVRCPSHALRHKVSGGRSGNVVRVNCTKNTLLVDRLSAP